jgi:hypothetical protein
MRSGKKNGLEESAHAFTARICHNAFAQRIRLAQQLQTAARCTRRMGLYPEPH